MTEIINDSPQWPWFNGKAGPTLVEKLLLTDCHPAWFNRVSMRRDQIMGDVWRTTPVNIWTHIFHEILTQRRDGCVGLRQIAKDCIAEAPHLVGSLRPS